MRKILCILFAIFGLVIPVKRVSAQIYPLAAQYYQNPYLINPAMAGLKEGLIFNAGYRRQLKATIGAPENTSVTVEYGKNKVGVGLNFYKDDAGLLNRNKLMLSYAYHLPFYDDEESMHFGLSIGLQRDILNLQEMIGSPNDQTALTYSDREILFDADFGMAYTKGNISVEGSFSNIKQQLKKEEQNMANYNTFYLAATYKVITYEWQFIPKAAFRGVRNYKPIIDLGFEVRSGNEALGALAMYHSNQSLSLGVSFQQNKRWQLMALYTTTTTPLKQSYTNGALEFGLRVNVIKADNYY